MKVVLAYITAKDKAEAKKLGKILLEKKLAACVNVFSSMESMYFWKGKFETSKEAVLLVKTLSAQKKKLLQIIKEKHSYSCPCVLFIEVKGGNPPYLKWLADSVL